MSSNDTSNVSRLEWDTSAYPPEVLERLMGPGAPFEMGTEVVAGYERRVFLHQPRTLRQMFEATVARQPDAVMMVSGERTWTFAQSLAESDRIAHVLREDYGVGPGDRVAIVSANSPEYGLTMWATISLGAIVTSLNGWWTAPELQYGIELTKPVVLFGDERRLARLDGATLPDGLPVVDLEDLYAVSQERPAEAPDASIQPDDPAVILFTSGTTGKPKGATLSHRNIISFIWANFVTGALGAASAPAPASPPQQPASILASPMFHISGMLGILMTGPAMGAKLVFPPPGRWDETQHLEMTAQHRINVWSGVPTQFWRILRHPDFDSYDLSCVTSIGGGGAPCPPELVREFHERMPWATLGQGYGMSETVGIGTRTGGPLILEHPDAVGVASPTVEVEVRDPLGEVVPPGEVGEIYLRTASVFLGYWDNEQATRDAIDAEGWYRTGDFGRIRNGLLYLESRMRDMILRGGENIYPIEIEHRLVEHPDIQDAAVIGVDHPVLGQEVKAFVIRRAGSDLDADGVKRWAAEALAGFKVPAHVEFRDTLPYTETGKVLKHLLEAEERAGSN